MTEDIQKACEIMQAGGIILYPTYDLGNWLRCDQRESRTKSVRVEEENGQ